MVVSSDSYHVRVVNWSSVAQATSDSTPLQPSTVCGTGREYEPA